MDAIFTFSKPSLESTVATSRVSRFVSETLQLPLYWDGTIGGVQAERLFIVNGAFAFCKVLPELALAIEAATHIIWVQQDYSIVPPKSESNAESPFRKAFRNRAAAGKHPTYFWTTCTDNVTRKQDQYINWNSLTYNPLSEEHVAQIRRKHAKDLFYYGAYRVNRALTFERYFRAPEITTTISSTSSKFSLFWDHPLVTIEDGMPRTNFEESLCRHGLGLYIEDDKSHENFHSPANRFYEMLGAGLPMVFQPEALPMLSLAGINVPPGHVVHSAEDIAAALPKASAIGRQQRQLWAKDYVAQLRRTVLAAYRAAQKG